MVLPRTELQALLKGYPQPPIVGAIGSHSALDIADGAAQEGFRTLVLAQKGRDRTYSVYYRAHRDAQGRVVRGCVDEVWTYPKFADAATPESQARLRERGVLLVPNRALSSYVSLDVLESSFQVPLVGSRNLLRIEDRTERENYYALLAEAGIPAPARFPTPQEIEGLAMVKLPHATRRLERGFFTAASFEEFQRKSETLIAAGTITPADLEQARIEQYILGPVFNFNFFFSPLAPRSDGLELLGVDERRESSLDGLVRLPAAQQLEIHGSHAIPQYTVVGHGTLTVRESLLEEIFDFGERFVNVTQSRAPPGIIGPFTLQTCLDRDGRAWVFDVAARIGGGTNIHLALGHPYGNALWRGPMSSGRRIAIEIRQALAEHRLSEIVT
jgi:5-formaminoimidazole-4-carboxamide-1-(beta)-D-ribofuranosyl 5'-monophosphate synthetase